MQTLLVRLKPYDARRGQVLRRYTYRGIKLHEERGWYRVGKDVADYLRDVRQVAGDKHAPLAFDVCTEAEAQALDAEHDAATTTRKKAAEAPNATADANATADEAEPQGAVRRGPRSK
jgi:hypothetical protein